jgi:solute carrier family 10 (sodium/bile acid cotransporter), member 7
MKKYLPDWFITGLLLMILVAWQIPGIGMDLQPVNLGNAIDFGVMMIFFFYGLRLDPEKLRRGMANWRMHLAIQSTTFILFPLLILPLYPLVNGTGLELYWIGLFYLAALPSTVSSSVVMVSLAGGNIPGAIFNASISGMIGIVATPLWMSLFLKVGGSDSGAWHITLQLITQIILPVVSGLLLHKYFIKWVSRYIRKLALFDKIIILLIVYESFSLSFQSGIFSSVSWTGLTGLIFVVVLLFFLVMYLTAGLARRMRFSREDSITLQFAGSKKSLVHGSVFASVLFTGVSGSGVFFNTHYDLSCLSTLLYKPVGQKDSTGI